MNVDLIPAACCAPIDGPELSDREIEATAALFRSLGDPKRVRLVNLLANHPGAMCVCDLTKEIGLSQATVSFHLKKLTYAGILQRENRGTWSYYSIEPGARRALTKAVGG